jgi:hypothetical protein
MDLIGLCGYYTLIAMVLNVAQVPIPQDAVPLGPPRPRAAPDGTVDSRPTKT